MVKTSLKLLAMLLILSIAAVSLTGCSGKNAKTADLKKTPVDSFSDISVTADVAAIDIIPEAGTFAIEYHIVNQEVSCSVKRGVLTLNAEGSENISIHSNEASYIKIYVPEGSALVSIDCESDVGNIRIRNIKADNIALDTDVGNVTLTDIEVNKRLTVEADVGNVEVSLVNAECSYTLSTGVGKVVINGTEFSGLDVKKSETAKHGPQVVLSADTGNIRFSFK